MAENTTTLIKFLGEEGTQALIDNTKALLSNKVDKIEGKSLSTNDYTTEEKEKLTSIEEGAQVNVTPDFDQSDPSSDDYIKNRTHWMEYEPEELLSSVTVDIDEYGNGYYETDIVLVEGEKYVVEFDDKSYVCTAKTFVPPDSNDTITYIGNNVFIDGTNSNDYPFILGNANVTEMEGRMMVAMIDMSTGELLTSISFTFSLGHFAIKEIHKLDPRYIDSPDWDAKEGETGHVLNRTHYRELEEVFPETVLEVVDGGVSLETKFNFEEGKTYIVNWNSVEYECQTSIYEEDGIKMLYIGDMLMVNPPFAIADIPDSQVTESTPLSMIQVGDGSTTLTLSIYCEGAFKKLDNDFLNLDWLPVMLDVDEMIISDVEITGSASNVQAIEGFTSEYFIVGTTYNIYLSGIKTTCEVKVMNSDDGDLYYLGNAAAINESFENTGEMFVIAYSDLLGTNAILKSFTDDTITLSIGKPTKVPNKLPNEFLDLDWYASDILVEGEEILPETELTSARDYITSKLTETLIPNQLYIIYINNDSYECLSFDEKLEYDPSGNIDAVGIGNMFMVNPEISNTGNEPFGIFYAANDGTVFSYPSFKEGDTVRIYKATYEPNKLPNKYLDLAWLPVMLPSEELFYEKTTGSGGMSNATNFDWSLLEVNESVVVYYNDERYETKVYIAEGIKYIGSLTYNSDELSEPFVIKNLNGTALFKTRDSNTTLKVYKLSTENLIPNKIPTEFLPDDIGGDVAFYVTVTANEDDTYSADKTFDELMEAYNDGKLIYCNIIFADLPFCVPMTIDTSLAGVFGFCGSLETFAFTIIITEENVNVTQIILPMMSDIPVVSTSFDKNNNTSAIANSVVAEKFEEVDEKLNTIPTTTSALTNDSGFITNAVSDLTNYYLKSETYSQEEINAKLSSIPKFAISVVTTLPTTDISETTVYLVASGEETDNLYTEYIYVNGKWEILGRQRLNLEKDWNQNDDTSSEYIKNRTHYVEKVEGEVLPETTLALTDGQAILNDLVLVIGETYVVNWNGTEYECVAEEYVESDVATGVSIGNISAMTGTNPTDEPFAMVYVYPELQAELGVKGLLVALDEIASVTISVTGAIENIHKLDNKYLDLDWFPTKTDEELEILPETTVDTESSISSINVAELTDYNVLILYIDGERIEHMFNINNMGSWFVGNNSLRDSELPNTGESYCIQLAPGIMCYFNDENEHTVSIKTYGVNKLPENYMPDSLSEIVIRNSDGQLFTITGGTGSLNVNYAGKNWLPISERSFVPLTSGKSGKILAVDTDGVTPAWVDPPFTQVQMITWEADD